MARGAESAAQQRRSRRSSWGSPRPCPSWCCTCPPEPWSTAETAAARPSPPRRDLRVSEDVRAAGGEDQVPDGRILDEAANGLVARPVALTRKVVESIKALGEDIDKDDVPEVDVEQLHDSGVLAGDGPVLRAGEHDGWSFAIEPEGSYLAADDIVRSVPRETVAPSPLDSESGSCWVSYADNGEILSSFDPLFPDCDYGTRPEALDRLTGHVAAINTGDRADAYASAVRAIQVGGAARSPWGRVRRDVRCLMS
ncbi:DUF6461 domain-containing protein [Streptomyces sp. NPDC057099]|uniref:DUF6461 domain-containing protein n=1 Tax=Streptomyces sp. NPDC057099 TaxID=3346019 RepID=UPI0036331A9F